MKVLQRTRIKIRLRIYTKMYDQFAFRLALRILTGFRHTFLCLLPVSRMLRWVWFLRWTKFPETATVLADDAGDVVVDDIRLKQPYSELVKGRCNLTWFRDDESRMKFLSQCITLCQEKLEKL